MRVFGGQNPFDPAPIGIKVLLPLLLGASLLIVLTDVMYYGGKRESLAALAEGYLIRVAIRLAQEDAREPGKVVVISATDGDYDSFPRVDSPLIRDVDMSAYAEVVTKVAAAKPRLVVVSWLAGAHPFDARHIRLLTEAVDRQGLRDRTLFALPFMIIGPIPEDLRRYDFRDADDCVYEVNSFCSYVKEWNWMIQALVDRLWVDPPPSHISTHLPHALPNFIANVPRESSIPVFSFKEVLAGKAAIRPGAVVMIGNAMLQDAQFSENKYVIQRTYTAGSPEMGNLSRDGTPFHAFWAQISQMFLDRTTVAVPTAATGWIITTVLGAFLLWVLLRLNLAAGFGVLVLYAVAFPLLNIAGVRHLKLYVPAFDTVYTGLIVFIAATFARLSTNAFRRWRLESRKRNFENSADLKSNFISLISHNLNTPVAKLRGLVDMLIKGESRQAPGEILRQASIGIAKLQLCTRSVLMATSLEVKAMAIMPTTVKALMDEFAATVGLTVQRLGYAVKSVPSLDEIHDEILYEMLEVDAKVVALAMAAMVALVKDRGQGLEMHFSMTENTAGGRHLAISLTLPRNGEGDSPFLVRSADEGTQRGDLNAEGDAFFAASLANFLMLATKAHGGDLLLKEQGKGVALVTLWSSAKMGNN